MSKEDDSSDFQFKERKFPQRGNRKMSLDFTTIDNTQSNSSSPFENKQTEILTSPRRTRKHLEHTHPLHVTKSASPTTLMSLKYEKPLPETPTSPSILSARERKSIFQVEEKKDERKTELDLSVDSSFEDIFDTVLEQISSKISLKNIKSQNYMEEVTKTSQSILLSLKLNSYSKYKVLVKGVKQNASEEETTSTILVLAKSNDDFLKKTLISTRKEEKYIIHKIQVYFFKLHNRLKHKKSILDSGSDINDFLIDSSETSREEDTIPRDYNGYKLNFVYALQHPEIKKAFVRHLQEESNLDPYEFIVRAQKLKKDPNWSDFEYIINTFVKLGSEKEINISGFIRTAILKKFDTGSDEKPFKLIEPAYNEIFRDLKDDVWTRFISTDVGYDLICRHSDDPNIISKDVRFCSFTIAFTFSSL